MKKSVKIIIGIVIAAIVITSYTVIHAVLRFFGYLNPVERYYEKVKTDMALENKYPGHDFNVNTIFGLGEYGYYLNIHAADENGIEFRVQWVEGEMEDHYHDEWNKYYYGKKIIEYQNSLRDEYFPQIPYVDTYEYSADDIYDFTGDLYKKVFFESPDEAIEASKSGRFDTEVTFKGIEFNTADDDEIRNFAESLADSLMWLHEQTGYYHIVINSFSYIEYDEYGAGYKTKDELVDSIIKRIEKDRKNNVPVI